MILVWHGETEDAARAAAAGDLARLERELAEQDARLPDDGEVLIAFACEEIDAGVGAVPGAATHRVSLRKHLGRALASADERPLARHAECSAAGDDASGRS